jgi:hypothetical protein
MKIDYRTETACDSRSNDPRRKDLGYALPAPIDTIRALCGDTNADDTAHNAVPREDLEQAMRTRKKG